METDNKNETSSDNAVATPLQAETPAANETPVINSSPQSVPQMQPNQKKRFLTLKTKKAKGIAAILVVLVLAVSGGVFIGIKSHNKPAASKKASITSNSFGSNTDLNTASQNQTTTPADYQDKIVIGPSKVEVQLKKTDGGGDSTKDYEESEKGKIFHYNLVSSGKTFYSFASKYSPSIFPFGHTQDKLILQRYDDLNSKFIIIDLNGKTTDLITEPNDAVFIHFNANSISRDNDTFVYSKISVQHTTCGGDTVTKIPDYSGPVYELHAYDLNSKNDIIIVKDERKPVPSPTEKFDFGLSVIGYSANNQKLYAVRKSASGCAGMDNIGAYEIDIAPNGTVRQIPYKKNTAACCTYPLNISPEGKYLYYDIYNSDRPEKERDEYHQYDLTTGQDIIVPNAPTIDD